MMLKAVLVAVLGLSVASPDRGDPRVPEIRGLLAQGVHEACAITQWPGPTQELAALMLTVGKHESRFALNIQAGRCAEYQCAPIRIGRNVVEFRARSWWQHERVFLEQERWDSIVGLDQEAISQAAILTAERLRSARYLCSGEDEVIRSTLRAYAGRGCSGLLPDEDARMASYRSFRRRL